jgi:hypothetical protein
MFIYRVIDCVPEMPYFLLALVYMMFNPFSVAVHVLAVTFFYMLTSLTLGLVLKAILKTARPVKYACIPMARYDVPSLHTIIAVGGVPFTYFINPAYCLITIPLALLYMYSRVKMSLHTVRAVYVGALVGLFVGAVFGFSLWRVDIRSYEGVFAFLFFVIPLSSTIYRLKYIGFSVA